MKPRLAELISQPGGIYAQEALARAEAALETLREPLLGSIDEALAELEQLSNPFDVDNIPTLYRLSGDIINFSLAERIGGVERAARSLCELLDEALPNDPTTKAGISVHIASLRLLHRRLDSEIDQASILNGLGRILAKAREAAKAAAA
ncbi:hypothetical protein AQ619_04940 [Caulobacter henricii]|uniref:Chemotaxis protein CheE n=2 Tax=Caulobacter henricii TaxID=69395 RepID=A0A0N7JH93_9CAUL|nr:hypothetical protein AQ619_04940 [Caulobacter henricii]